MCLQMTRGSQPKVRGCTSAHCGLVFLHQTLPLLLPSGADALHMYHWMVCYHVVRSDAKLKAELGKGKVGTLFITVNMCMVCVCV